MPDGQFPVAVVQGVPVVTMPEEIDITTAEALRSALLAAATNRHKTVVADMTGTRFCDSSGLHTLLRAHKLAMSDGGEMRLVVPASGAVPRVLALTSLHLFIPCFPSLAAALAQSPAAPAVTPWSASSARSWPSSTTSGPKCAATSASTSSPKAG
jgi:anti-sigma B factor antagonist